MYLARRRRENFQVLQCKIVKYIALVRSRREKIEDRNCDDVETVTKIASLLETSPQGLWGGVAIVFGLLQHKRSF